MFKIYFEPEPPVANEGPCLMPRTEIAKGGVVFQIKKRCIHIYIYMTNRYRRSPKEGACLNYMLNRNRLRERVLCVEPKSPNEGSCLRYMMNRYRQRKGRV